MAATSALMSSPRVLGLSPTRWGWSLCGLSVSLAVAAMVLAGVNGESPNDYVTSHYAIGTVSALFFPLVGAAVVARDRRNLLGWLMCVDGVTLGVFNLAQQYAPLALGLTADRRSHPGGELASWLGSWTNVPGIVLGSVFVILLFPDGHLPSRRWRPVAWLGAAVAVVPTAVLAVAYWSDRGPNLVNETGTDSALVSNLFAIAFGGALLLTAAAAVSLILRFRRSSAVQRQQIKWFAYGAVLSAPLGAFAMNGSVGAYLELMTTPVLLAGLGIGIFRYRLWEIDRLVNRTLVYGLLTAILGGAYAVGVLVIGQRVSPGKDPPGLVVAATTLAVAALFQPLRRAIQRLVDRRFNRRRYDAAKTIDAFATRLRQQVDLHALTSELLAVVDHTMQPAGVSLWLRPQGAPSPPGRAGGPVPGERQPPPS
jgi:ABC-type multidrug transport system fused ATPase/permease subunit